MASSGSYAFRDGKFVKISDRIPRLSGHDSAKEDASVASRLAEGYRHLERRGNLRRIGPDHYTKNQLRTALDV